jgi:CRISPR-associated protein Csm3
MYGKLKITAKIHVLTGMHIGGSNVFSAIGSVDSPVIRDARTQLPIIPGSSLKGKLRTLMVRDRSDSYKLSDVAKDPIEVARLFGTMQNSSGNQQALPSRLQFCDCFINQENLESLKEIGTTEVKFENTINRLSGVANPRQIERVIAGTVFDFVLLYEIVNQDECKEDFQNLSSGFKLLQMDYLGGHGTRGYGKVAFKDFRITAVNGCLPEQEVAELTAILKEVEKSELFSV